jgi:hypothetical protein
LILAENTQADLVAHYKLDETTGLVAVDSSGNSFDCTELKIYIDDVLAITLEYTGSIASTDYSVNLGRNAQNTTRFYEGLLDDARIYNRVLSHSEIGYLADQIPGDGELYIPIQSDADVYSAEAPDSRIIDVKDYALMATEWPGEVLWP